MLSISSFSKLTLLSSPISVIAAITFVSRITLVCLSHAVLTPGVTVTTTNRGNTGTTTFLSFSQRILSGPDALTDGDKVMLGVIVLLALELLSFVSKHSGQWMHAKQIPVRGKHLDDLSWKDLVFIALSKAGTAPFTYFYLQYTWRAPLIWSMTQLSLVNTVLALILLFVVFDFFYTILHWALHIKSIYGWIHKHHHHQKAPSRATVDAINVHPIEFILGEYNHLWSLYLVHTYLTHVHIVTALVFLVLGGILAGINHTRYDVCWKLFGVTIYDSKAHDVHHRIPQSNYGQYTMLWDVVFGSFRAYDPKDRINPDAQLDPKTGKSIQYNKKIK